MDRAARAVLDALDGTADAALVRAPGRVNLIGDHTDYNAGFCLPMAIDRACVVGVRRSGAHGVLARSADLEGVVAWTGAPPSSIDPPWGRFVAAAARHVQVDGVELAVASTVPVGAGLSSSAALCVALVLALRAAPDPMAVAAAARAIEVEATGVPVGLLDQVASVFGQADAALLLDCRGYTVEPVPLPASARVGVVHSGLPRTLESSAYAERRAASQAARRLGLAALRDAEPDQVRDDPLARHVVSENARVLEAAAAMRVGDTARLGALFVASHESLRDDFSVSTPELDLLVELLLEEGALGARLTGAGFGGCVVALTPATDEAGVLERAADRYASRTGRVPSAFPVRAAAGAGPMALS